MEKQKLVALVEISFALLQNKRLITALTYPKPAISFISAFGRPLRKVSRIISIKFP